MTGAPIHLTGVRLMLDPAGVMIWPDHGLLAFADLHLGKGAAAARQGRLLPPWDSRMTLDRLGGLLRRYTPRIIVALGDSFHDALGAHHLPRAEAARIAAIAAAHRLIWVAGNHDPAPPPRALGGEWVAEFRLGPLVFRHQAASGPAQGEISGHFHPKARIATRAATITRPCFLTNGQRLLLPAFGAYTGGLDITDPAIATLFPRGARAFLLGEARLFSFPVARPPGGRMRPAQASGEIAPASASTTPPGTKDRHEDRRRSIRATQERGHPGPGPAGDPVVPPRSSPG